MTLKQRNRLLFSSYFFTLPSIAIYLYALLSFFQSENPLKYISTSNFIFFGIFLVTNIFASIFIFRNFKNTQSIEIFYFITFLNFSTLYAISPIIPLLYITESAAPFLILTIKVIFFTHFIATILLFFVSFFKINLEIKNPEKLLFAAIAISLLFAGLQPTDYAQYGELLELRNDHTPSALLLTTANQHHFFVFLSIFMITLTLACSILSFIQTTNKHYLFQGISLLLLSAGIGIIIFQTPWQAQIVGIILYLIAIPIFATTTHQQYKWS